MNAILVAALPYIVPSAVSIACAAIAWLAQQAISAMRKQSKLAALAYVAQVSADSLEAAVKAAGADVGKAPAYVLKDAAIAAKNVVLAGIPDIEQSLELEIDTLITHHVAAAAGSPVVAPGGATVVLPSLSKEA